MQRLHLGSAEIKNNLKPRFLKRLFQVDTIFIAPALHVFVKTSCCSSLNICLSQVRYIVKIFLFYNFDLITYEFSFTQALHVSQFFYFSPVTVFFLFSNKSPSLLSLFKFLPLNTAVLTYSV